MGKPSIFSRDYKETMKRRRRRVLAILLVLIFCGGIFLLKGNISNFISNKFSALLHKSNKNTTSAVKDQKDKAATNATNNSSAVSNPAEKGIDITLSDGTKIKAVYENKDGVNKFKYVTPVEAPIIYSINPSGDSIIILENATQKLFYAAIDGKVININDTKYVSTSGTVFPKEEVLKQKPDFVWCSSPKFIDDSYVAYISQVPWFGRTAKYVWVFNVKDRNISDRNDHMLFESLGGENIKLGNITDKGLEVITDNAVKYLKSNGTSVKINE